MAYIRVVEKDEAQGTLKDEYDAFMARRGHLSNMVKAFSLRFKMLQSWHTFPADSRREPGRAQAGVDLPRVLGDRRV